MRVRQMRALRRNIPEAEGKCQPESHREDGEAAIRPEVAVRGLPEKASDEIDAATASRKSHPAAFGDSRRSTAAT
jgi:hypothetical protein